jgi:hypothetical protein
MKFKDYLTEMTCKYTRKQKENLSHVILNILMDPNAAKLLKKVKATADKENVIITKQEAEAMLSNLKKIRQLVIDLPMEEE